MPTHNNALLTPHRAATHDDDGHDQIGSTSSTPPGASTPRPDPTDKRLPGILHSYFGQVRDSLLPQSKSSSKSSNPAPASSDAASMESKEKDSTEKAAPHQTMLPSPAPSASSRTPSASQLNGETEKLTEGDFSSPQNQATPPQTPRTRSQEGKPPTSSLSRTSLASNNSRESKGSNKSDKDAAVVGAPKGKLAVTITEGRDLRASTDPYCVIQFQWAEYISDGPKHDDTKGRRGPMQMRRTESEMQKPMAIPMKSRQSSNSGHSSDAREDNFEETTNPTWEHEAELYVPCKFRTIAHTDEN